MIKPFTIVFLGAITAGCATSQQNAALECGAGGAIAAGLLCKLAGGNTTDCVIAGAAGGGIGALGCYAWSDKLKKDEDALKGHEDDLDYRLTYVRNVNQTMTQANDSLRQKIDALSTHNAAAGQQVSTAADKQTQLGDQQATLTDRNKQIDKLIAEAQKSIDDQKTILAKNRAFQASHPNASPDLAQAIKHEEAILADTERQAKALAAMRTSV